MSTGPSDQLKGEVLNAIKTIKTTNFLVRSYKAKYGCATLHGEQLEINKNPELWHAVDSAKSFDSSGHELLEELGKLFTKYWNDILQERERLRNTGETLELSTFC